MQHLRDPIKLVTKPNVELLQRVSNLECLASKFFDKNDYQNSAAGVANLEPKKKNRSHSKKSKALDNLNTNSASAEVNEVELTEQESGIDKSLIE